MPVDPDAYMAGAIPTLSRGGSWVPAAHPGHPANGTIANPHPMASAAGSYQDNDRASTVMSGGGSLWNPLYSPFAIFPLLPSPMSMRFGAPSHYSGMMGSMAQSQQSGTSIGTDVSAVQPNQPARPSMPRRATTMKSGLPQTPNTGAQIQLDADVSDDFPADRAPTHHTGPQDVKAAPGAPRPGKPVIHRKRADSLPPVPPPELEPPSSFDQRKERKKRSDRPSSNSPPERDRTYSGSESMLHARKAVIPRPPMRRIISHGQESYTTLKKPGGRSDTEGSVAVRDVAADHAKRSPPSRRQSWNLVNPKKTSSDRSQLNPPMATVLSPRPPAPRDSSPRHNHRQSHGTALRQEVSPVRKRNGFSPDYRHPPRSQRSHRSSDKNGIVSDLRAGSGRDLDGRIMDFTGAPSSHGSKGGSDRRSRYDLSTLSRALPDSSVTSPTSSSFTTSTTRMPTGYISPTQNDGYDRYAAHPAGPTPSEFTSRSGVELRTAESPSGIPPTSPSLTSPTSPADTTYFPEGDSVLYLPLGYARPTKEIGWNREGPAMKTHGVAWNRHQEGMVLPETPDGSRWIQARPPRAEMVAGGSWWESGGQGR